MEKALKVLIIEDSEFDARVMMSVLRQGGYEVSSQRVESGTALRDALGTNDWDIILSDYNLPDFQAPEALRILKSTGMDVPFIIISGGIGEDVAVAAMKAGAHDYLMKGQLARLVVAVEREMREAQTRRSRHHVEAALKESEQRNRLLWENSSDAVLLMDSIGVIHFSNPATNEIFDHPTDDLIGSNIDRLFGESGRSELRSNLVASGGADGESKGERRLFEAQGVTRDGRAIILETALSSLELHGRRMHVAFIRDITARKEAEKELREHEEQFRVARDIQQWMFPKKAPHFPGFDVAGVSFPAAAAGGDYFDYVSLLGDRIGFVVADVTGHGIGPALLMAEARAYLRVLAKRREDLGEILTRANSVLAEDLSLERYITMILVALDPDKRELTWSNAGHPSGLVVAADGSCRMKLKRTGPPLGIREDTEYSARDGLALLPGDIVVLVTDGFEEALSDDDEFFGVERICAHVHEQREAPSSEILASLRQAVGQFVGRDEQDDDLTGIIVKVDPTAL
jgi:phosphoserine phosphatase RsbU/P